MMTQQIVALGAALEQAARDDNWLQVMQIDKQIANLLQQLRQKTLNEATLAQVKTLQQRHLGVMAHCRTRIDELSHKLQQHQTQRHGLQAYSLFNGEGEGVE
ncbi:hypothetical protein GJV08_11130 [Enterobacteriaceae bacterium RIT692]|nr:hypothetical protein [Enterobacteriaceae bacterium RIT692]